MCEHESKRQQVFSGDETMAERQDEMLHSVWQWPEDAGNSLVRTLNNKLFYSYMNRVLNKGAALHRQRRALAQKDGKQLESNQSLSDNNKMDELGKDDLYASPSGMSSKKLQVEFQRLWQAEQTRKEQQQQQQGKSPSSTRSAFLRILWGLAKPTYLPAAFYQLVQIIAQIANPVLLRTLLIEMENNPDTNILSTGLPIAIGFFLMSVIQVVAMERQRFLAFQTGIALKAAIVNAVYDHVLGLTPAGKVGLTSGEATNLVAVDAQKLFELTQEGHQAWGCPLSMVIVTILLLLEMGPSTLVGMATMFLLVPFVQKIVEWMMHFRKKRVALADRRVETTTAMLQGIKFTKLNNYEGKFLQRILAARSEEMKFLRKELFVLGITFFITVISPVIASSVTYATYALVSEDNVLTASTTFTTLFLFGALRFPISFVGKFMGKAAQGLQACDRLAAFFTRESAAAATNKKACNDINHSHNNGTETIIENDDDKIDGDTVLTVVDGSYIVGSSDDTGTSSVDTSTSGSFTVSNINMTLKRSQVLCVVGPVGSGKSTLCQGLIGDVPIANKSSKVTFHGKKKKVSYASQTAFILNATIRENILFGEEYDKDRYDRVLDACCLLPDLKQVGPAGDLTEIGERGVTLSGGQKQRISLARVAYSQPDVAIFDDPLSALDASTANSVFEKLFRGGANNTTHSSGGALLRNTAVVLVTHAAHFLHRVDQIMILAKGKPAFMGNWDALGSFRLDTTDRDVVDFISLIQAAVQEEDEQKQKQQSKDGNTSPGTTNVVATSATNAAEGLAASGDLMTIEEREFGLSDWRTWLTWFKYAGGILFVVGTVLALFVDRFFFIVVELWLAVWTSAADTEEPVTWLGRDFPPQSEGRSAQYEYVAVLAIILLISFVGTFLRSQWIILAGARCSGRLFTLMTQQVAGAPMSYFETTPLGRILNRFTYDMETLDITLTTAMMMLMTSAGWFWAGVILQAIILPWQLIALAVIMTIYLLVLLHYRKSAVDLQRLDNTSRSPVQAQLSEIMDGASTIRVFEKVPHFSRIFRSSLDENSSAMMNFMAAQRWLSTRAQIAGSISVLFSVCFLVAYNEVLQIPAGMAGVLVIWTNSFTITMSFSIQAISESEAALTSVERVAAMTELPQEKDAAPNKGELMDLKQDWPSNGRLVFENVAMRYRPGLPLSLDGLSFTLESGQRCGVVGRTGAGKSTLTVALFRLVEIERGMITLDGVDLSRLGLADVRGRKNGMCIIPQDPVLFSGSLRECLDPFGDCTDEQVLDALQAVRVANASQRGLDALRDHVDEGGRNYSVGERQLLCLARAILSRPKLLVLDEATASVDSETDAFIQRMIRSRFVGTTLLTIAHRLNTIMDYDVILAMDNGKAAEFGTPRNLLDRENGLFRSLVDSTGKESSAALRSMVDDNC